MYVRAALCVSEGIIARWSDGETSHSHTHTHMRVHKQAQKKDPHTWTDRNRQRDGHMDPYIIYSCVYVCLYVQAKIYDVCMCVSVESAVCVTCVRATWPAVVTGSEAFNGI